jgi:anthranilate synthase component 1
MSLRRSGHIQHQAKQKLRVPIACHPAPVKAGTSAAAIVRRLPVETDLLAIHASDPARYPFFLESAASGTRQGRFDILFAFPGEAVAARGADRSFLPRFDAAWRSARDGKAAPASGSPFAGGWFVYLGYELAAEIEPSMGMPAAARPALDDTLPIAMAIRVPAAIIRDRQQHETLLVAEHGCDHLIALLEGDMRAALPPTPTFPVSPLLGTLEEETPERFLAIVETAKNYILAGDIYQANLSRLWRGQIAPGINHAALYDRLRRANPAPFAGLATFGDRAILSSSPERLVEVRGGKISARPIAGTRPRGIGGGDAALMSELIAHPKERAEHIMLLDLARNDLSRVAIPGTVRVDEMMTVESYTHVHHIVSNVVAACAPDITPSDVIRAAFPGGTITGCPKIRSMEIIAELEGVSRGPYTGALGYIGHDGSMDLNILIRTMLRDGERITFRTGAGIVADSEPERELAETRAKAIGLARALIGDWS